MSVSCWGAGGKGQCGPTKHRDLYEPRTLDSLRGIQFVSGAAGEAHTLLLSEFGRVWAFGRNKEGQLGLGLASADGDKPVAAKDDITAVEETKPGRWRRLKKQSTTSTTFPDPTPVDAIGNHVVTSVACGSQHSMAVTSAGKVFSWGLIPVGSVINENLLLAEENGPKEKGGGGSASGGGGGGEEVPGRDKAGSGLSLIGGAGIGQVGLASNNLDSHQLPGRSQGRSRYLREVVESSAVSYYTDGDVAFGDFKGAQAAKKKIESGLLTFDLKRYICRRPGLVASLLKVKVVEVAAGHGHSLARTDTGALYSAGYNDRGQLGNGTRLAASHFMQVQALKGLIVRRIACGMQHSVAIVDVPEEVVATKAAEAAAAEGFSSDSTIEDDDEAGFVTGPSPLTSKSGPGKVFVWGSNSLGQLGLGRDKGGRLTPEMVDQLPVPAKACAAGDNHTVIIALDGKSAWSWGHSEYGQHCDKIGYGGNDLTEFTQIWRYYHVPRELLNITALIRPNTLEEVRCGRNFNTALDCMGNLYTWGWNAHGCLGRGKGAGSLGAKVIVGRLNGKVCRAVVAGANHACSIEEARGSLFAEGYASLLSSDSANNNADLCIRIVPHEDALAAPSDAGASLRTKRIVAPSRGRKLKIRKNPIAESISQRVKNLSAKLDKQLYKFTREEKRAASIESAVAAEQDGADCIYAHRVVVGNRCPTLRKVIADAETRINAAAIASHTASAASAAAATTAAADGGDSDSGNGAGTDSIGATPSTDEGSASAAMAASMAAATIVAGTEYKVNALTTISIAGKPAAVKALVRYLYCDYVSIPKAFAWDLLRLAKVYELERLERICAELLNLTDRKELIRSDFTESMMSAAVDNTYADVIFNCEDGTKVFAHKAIIERYAFFQGLLSGHFIESTIVASDENENKASNQCQRVTWTSSTGKTLQHIVQWAYSGNRKIVCEDNVMELLATAKVLAIDDLADVCESFVRARLDKENARDALEFALFHGVDRLAAAARHFLST